MGRQMETGRLPFMHVWFEMTTATPKWKHTVGNGDLEVTSSSEIWGQRGVDHPHRMDTEPISVDEFYQRVRRDRERDKDRTRDGTWENSL